MALPPSVARSVVLNFSVQPIPYHDRGASDSDTDDDFKRAIPQDEGDQKWAWRLDVVTGSDGSKACVQVSDKAMQWDSPEEALQQGLVLFDEDVLKAVDLVVESGCNVEREAGGVRFYLYSLGYFNHTQYSWKIDYWHDDQWMLVECSNFQQFWPTRADAVKRAEEVFEAHKDALVADARERMRAPKDECPPMRLDRKGTYSLWGDEDTWY